MMYPYGEIFNIHLFTGTTVCENSMSNPSHFVCRWNTIEGKTDVCKHPLRSRGYDIMGVSGSCKLEIEPLVLRSYKIGLHILEPDRAWLVGSVVWELANSCESSTIV